MEETRTKKALRNLVFSLISQLVIVVIKIFQRKIMVDFLGDEVLGLNAVFSNIVSIFSLIEIGFGTAISFLLYKPLAEGDNQKVRSFIAFYKKIYFILGIITIALFCGFAPFVKFFTKGVTVSTAQLISYFLLFAISTSISYFFSHTHALLWADQKGFIDKIVSTVFTIIFTILQMLAMYFFRNFYAYLIVLFFTNLIPNIYLQRVVYKKYPFLKEKNPKKLEKEDYREIKKKVSGLFLHRISTTVSNSIDNIILSTMIGVVTAGLFSNYFLLFVTIVQLIMQVIYGTSASIGNLWVSGDNERVKTSFYRLKFILFLIYGFATIALVSLTGPFIDLWLGASYNLGLPILICFAVNFYVANSRLVVVAYKENKGIYEKDIYRPICEIILKIALSIAFVKLFGVAGVLVGSIVSAVLTGVWIEPMVLFKYGFKENVFKYIINYFLYAVFVAVVGAFFYWICSFIGGGVWWFALKVAIVGLGVPLVLLVCFCRKKEMIYLFQMIRSIVRRKKSAKAIDIVAENTGSGTNDDENNDIQP